MITKITPPTFTIANQIVNEYELRNILLETARGKTDFVGMLVTCNLTGQQCTIDKFGRLSDYLEGLNLVTDMIESMWEARSERQTKGG